MRKKPIKYRPLNLEIIQTFPNAFTYFFSFNFYLSISRTNSYSELMMPSRLVEIAAVYNIFSELNGKGRLQLGSHYEHIMKGMRGQVAKMQQDKWKLER